MAIERPVFHLVIGFGFAYAEFFHSLYHGFDGVFDFHSVKETAVYHRAAFFRYIRFLFYISACNNFDYRQTELFGELVVAGIVSGYRHNSARAVVHHDVVCGKYGYFRSCNRINRVYSLDENAALFLSHVYTLELFFHLSLTLIIAYFGYVFYSVGVLFEHRVFGTYHKESHSVDSIRTGGVDIERIFLVSARYVENNFRALTFSYPVRLFGLYFIEEVEVFKSGKKSVGVISYFQEPYVLDFLLHFAAATVADPVLALLGGKDYLTLRTEIDEGLRLVRKTFLEHLHEYPLSPTIVVRVGGVDSAVVVERKSHFPQLLVKVLYVFVRDYSRMLFSRHRVVFGGESERVVPYREKYVVPFHSAFTSDHFQTRIRSYVSDVNTRSRRIRKLYQRVKFLLLFVFGRVKNVVVVPIRLPLLFNFFWIVCLYHIFLSISFFIKTFLS